ncbi:MAG: GNAT family N-acetyltransferase [Mizugakiibacter sp.]|uniref:GNAT family N-acetyltransferase n=1 Tax=Mizugakiibacter sp. TaxID=1972610 RepID=UPI0031BEE8B9|nr:GNAT family N-acetyltransferase [Xanthomonadaceae bacterium]
MNDAPIRIRLAEAEDDAFILGLAERFTGFDLPGWRKRGETTAGIRRDLERHLREQPPNSYMFVAEDDDGARVGFLHLQKVVDFFTGQPNCHISDLAVAPDREGRGIGRALLAYADDWAREHHCRLVTLAAFPANERARALYEKAGFGIDLLRLAKPLK